MIHKARNCIQSCRVERESRQVVELAVYDGGVFGGGRVQIGREGRIVVEGVGEGERRVGMRTEAA